MKTELDLKLEALAFFLKSNLKEDEEIIELITKTYLDKKEDQGEESMNTWKNKS